MTWLWERIDRLLCAVAVAFGAAMAAQLDPLATQFLARTGPWVAAAEAHLADVRTGLKYQVMADTVRRDLERAAEAELSRRRALHDPVARAGPVGRPLALLRVRGQAPMAETWASFVPALPRGAGATVYAVIGLVLGFLAYEALRWPVMKLVVDPPKRRFKRR
ncbi:MAG: hypothetical protein SFV21_07285 [Rhodospirillaceae bacterium]|nr:hypothetical protein [Rhodospirillaceae bacterium]